MTIEADDHTKALAKAGGREAARELMLTLGMDVSTPEGIRQVQRDLIFLRDLRVGTAAMKRKMFLTIAGAIVTAMFAYMVLGFKGH